MNVALPASAARNACGGIIDGTGEIEMRSSHIRRARHVCGSCSCALVFLASLHGGAAAAQGTDGYPISGTATINGQSGALPPDGTFSGSSYDPLTGVIAAGTFKFPATTVTQGGATLTYQLSQVGTSDATVDDGGNVVFVPATMVLTLLDGTYNGVPVTFGSTCVFAPIDIELSGTGSSAGLDVGDAQFDIPPTTDDCNNFAVWSITTSPAATTRSACTSTAISRRPA